MSLQNNNPTGRFSNRAKHYAQARPDYPDAALDFVCSHCSLSADKQSHLLDIGAGTGISSRAFAAHGLQVTALEPNQAMLDEARSHPDFRERISFVQAKAEETGLAESQFDAILCAQAFHWFDPDKALLEFHRLLKPKGWVVLIWNERNEKDDSFTREYGNLLRTLPETSRVELKRQEAGLPLLQSRLFNNQSKNEFYNQQILDLDKLVGRALSASYAPPPETSEAKAFELELQKLFQRFEKNGSVVIKYECSVYTGQKG